jgi:hypothetical protein
MSDQEIVEVITDGPTQVIVTPDPVTQIVEVDYGTMGPRGPVGPRGQAGAGSLETTTFVYVQPTPEAVWMITHPLPFIPTVTIVDSAGNEQIGSISYVGTDTIVVSFGTPFSGTAYLS